VIDLQHSSEFWRVGFSFDLDQSHGSGLISEERIKDEGHSHCFEIIEMSVELGVIAVMNRLMQISE
jgi:hypothetical protein